MFGYKYFASPGPSPVAEHLIAGLLGKGFLFAFFIRTKELPAFHAYSNRLSQYRQVYYCPVVFTVYLTTGRPAIWTYSISIAASNEKKDGTILNECIADFKTGICIKRR
jgi:hypothetical protein